MLRIHRLITTDFMYFSKTCQKPSKIGSQMLISEWVCLALGSSFHCTYVEISVVSYLTSTYIVSWNYILRSSKMQRCTKRGAFMAKPPADIPEGKSLIKRSGGKTKRCIWLSLKNHNHTVRVINCCTLFYSVTSKPHPSREQWKKNTLEKEEYWLSDMSILT